MKNESCRHPLAARVALAVLATAPLAALAQSHMTPGLWETTITTSSQNGQTDAAMAQMQDKLASLPPDQRKMVEAQMASRGMGMGAKPNVVRVCVTKEQAEREAAPPSDGRCQPSDMTRSGGTVKYKVNCSGTPPTTGEGEFTMAGANSYTGVTTVTTQIQGKSARIETHISGKWLAADCGNVAPRGH